MTRFSHIKRVCGKPVVVLLEGDREMVFNKESLEGRIENLEKLGRNTSEERIALTRLEEEVK